jgi:hypothetical protein
MTATDALLILMMPAAAVAMAAWVTAVNRREADRLRREGKA